MSAPKFRPSTGRPFRRPTERQAELVHAADQRLFDRVCWMNLTRRSAGRRVTRPLELPMQEVLRGFRENA